LFRELINVTDAIMHTNILNKIFFLSLLLSWLSACTDAGPYIFNANEFNRDAPGFGKLLKDRSKVEICYNKKSTTPEIVTQIAKDECGRFGKAAHFFSNGDLTCSIGSPAKAIYWCLCPGEPLQDRLRNHMGSVKGEQEYKCSKP
jgi:hypothetical protein